jgi:hypothetical protein
MARGGGGSTPPKLLVVGNPEARSFINDLNYHTGQKSPPRRQMISVEIGGGDGVSTTSHS